MPDTAYVQQVSSAYLGDSTAVAALDEELDRHWSAIQFGQGTDGVERLVAFLAELWDAATETDRIADVSTVIRRHPIMQLLLEDPFTRRSFEKPRGYAGDAVMLDYIYRPQANRFMGIAQAVCEGTTKSSTGRSFLWRQQYLGNLIARTAIVDRAASILSVASGHVRELDTVGSLLKGTDIRLTCLDSDADALAEACREVRDIVMQSLNWSVTRLLRGKSLPEKYSLIYSAGLCDHLSDRILIALVRILSRHLEPGGILSLANFTPEAKGRGYLEFCMDWRLTYRSDDEMLALIARALPESRPRVFRDGEGGVVYVEITA